MNIDSNFDGGNIEYVSCNDDCINLNIRKDIHADYRQWFYFRAQSTSQETNKKTFRILNASKVSYPEAWDEGTIVASYDRKEWFRVATTYNDETLSFTLTPEQQTVYFALYIPYSYERHNDLIAWATQQQYCELFALGKTCEDRPVELLKIAKPHQNNTKNIWIIARQHPAETMAEWFIEGLLESLLDSHNATAQALLNHYSFYIAPHMNPDGGITGNLRTNGTGTDLNRSWLNIDFDKSPESAFILTQMDSLGVDLFLDIHGDEEIPFVFAAGCEGNPSYSDALAKQDKAFRQTFHSINPDFRCENGYEADLPGEADLSIACNQIGERFNCLSLTIEMPFKENKYIPNEKYGWSTERCKQLGSATLNTLHQLGPKP